MPGLNPESLALTVDAVSEAFFFGTPWLGEQKQQTAEWIAGRQGKPGSYAGMFAPTRGDFESGIRLFTGERVRSRVGISHILGEETCRALILMDVPTPSVREALRDATLGMMARLDEGNGLSGTYCCGTCSPALWRHLAAGGLENPERRLVAGMEALRARRDGEGRWRTFPFYYTLLTLSEIDLPSAVEEMRYASSVCTRLLKRPPKDDVFQLRRLALLERVLARC